MDLRNKVVLITGGGTGIGKSTALHFARENSLVHICGRREAPLKDTADRNKLKYTVADVTTGKGVVKVLEDVLLTYGRIDILE
ncbi:SDR family NAD(P)-dependent oxidoreductase [Candidatus Woesearchaeota archaeon]|nr:SDR family NAD(P)-dependent oxidoreductase [Candidatus Woesearchaeota archaeon]